MKDMHQHFATFSHGSDRKSGRHSMGNDARRPTYIAKRSLDAALSVLRLEADRSCRYSGGRESRPGCGHNLQMKSQ
jgi:hypothetical protein